MKQLADTALADITIDIAKACVWGLFDTRMQDAQVLAAQRGTRLSEDEIAAVATYWIAQWGIGEATPKPRGCAFCSRTIPAHSTALCHCFQLDRVGQYIDYTVPGAIRDTADKYPGRWRNLSAEAYACVSCSAVTDVPLGRIADIMNQGKLWRTPQFCKKCSDEYHQKHGRQRPQQPSQGPARGAMSAPVPNQTPPPPARPTNPMEELQQEIDATVVGLFPPPAEG